MSDQLTKACINMKGVLRSLTYLCDLDAEASGIVKNTTLPFSSASGKAPRRAWYSEAEMRVRRRKRQGRYQTVFCIAGKV
jgi:hypothetical protein